jgi:hypothetical protein
MQESLYPLRIARKPDGELVQPVPEPPVEQAPFIVNWRDSIVHGRIRSCIGCSAGIGSAGRSTHQQGSVHRR